MKILIVYVSIFVGMTELKFIDIHITEGFPGQCMKVKRESEVAQSWPTLSDPMDCSLPGSSIHGIFHARVLEWVAIA